MDLPASCRYCVDRQAFPRRARTRLGSRSTRIARRRAATVARQQHKRSLRAGARLTPSSLHLAAVLPTPRASRCWAPEGARRGVPHKQGQPDALPWAQPTRPPCTALHVVIRRARFSPMLHEYDRRESGSRLPRGVAPQSSLGARLTPRFCLPNDWRLINRHKLVV